MNTESIRKSIPSPVTGFERLRVDLRTHPLGNGLRDVALQTQRVTQIALVYFCPEVPVGEGAQKLHPYSHCFS